jgi:hypothetical protein
MHIFKNENHISSVKKGKTNITRICYYFYSVVEYFCGACTFTSQKSGVSWNTIWETPPTHRNVNFIPLFVIPIDLFLQQAITLIYIEQPQ